MPAADTPVVSPDGATDPVLFDRAGAEKVLETVRWVDHAYRGVPPQRSGVAPGLNPLMLARVTTTCNARSGSAPGQNGRGYLQLFDGTNLSDDTATGIQVILNLQNKTYVSGSDSYAPVLWMYGAWWIPSPADCAKIV